MSDDIIKLTDEAVEKLFASLLMNFISCGEEEAGIIEANELTESQQSIVMKANTLFTVAAMHYMTVLQDKDLDTMRKVLTIWTTPMIHDLVNIAFESEIKNASTEIDDAINQMEKEANKNASTE